MPEIVAEPPSSSCYRLFPASRIQESQGVDSDRFLPRARVREGAAQRGARETRAAAGRHPQSRALMSDLAARAAESLRKNRERASRRSRKSLVAFPAKARMHPSTGACASNNHKALPTDEKFVRRSNGPRLWPARRIDDRQRNSFTNSERAGIGGCGARIFRRTQVTPRSLPSAEKGWHSGQRSGTGACIFSAEAGETGAEASGDPYSSGITSRRTTTPSSSDRGAGYWRMTSGSCPGMMWCGLAA